VARYIEETQEGSHQLLLDFWPGRQIMALHDGIDLRENGAEVVQSVDPWIHGERARCLDEIDLPAGGRRCDSIYRQEVMDVAEARVSDGIDTAAGRVEDDLLR
jgi:hypothetical protein